MKNLLSGKYGKEYEDYSSDQFIGRDRWIGFKTRTEMTLGQVMINGVYLGKEESLFEQHLSKYAGGDGRLEENAERKLTKLVSDIKQYRSVCKDGEVRVMLVPSAYTIWENRLPPYTASLQFSETDFLEEGREQIERSFPGERIWVDVQAVLAEHATEEVYYRTDHHWTTLGAYYGYTAWADSMDMDVVLAEKLEQKTVSSDFQGTLQSKLNIPWEKDIIKVFLKPDEPMYELIYDMGEKTSDSLYEESYLNTKNQYGFFLDDNHGLITIRTNGTKQQERSIVVIKDSYANCFVPFLTEYYGTVYVIDRRYYRGNVSEFLEEKQIQDVLVLYNVIQFLENY